MFPKQKKKNANRKNGGNGIRGGQPLLNIGNEAANQTDGFQDLISNEANNAAMGLDDSLMHYAENDLNKLVLNTGEENKKKEIPAEIIKEGLGGYYENDLNNLTLNKPKIVKNTNLNKKKKRNNNINNDINNINNINNDINTDEKQLNLINDPEPKGMAEKDQPDDVSLDMSQGSIKPLIEEIPGGLIDYFINEKPKNDSGKKEKKGKKGSKSSKKSSAPKAAALPQRDEDLTQIDQSLEPVQGWDFTAQKLPARKRQKWLSKLGSWAAYYGGKTIGKIGGIFAWLGKAIGGLFFKGPGTMGGTFKRLRGSSKFEPRRNRNLIPGWDGAEYQNEEGSEDEVSLDFRRIPEIWSYPIAETPVEGDSEDRNAKPRDPVISVYISQASDKYTVTKNGSTGHTGIGVEYSRYSAMSGRWQRYNLRFGYYIGGGGASLLTKMAVSSYSNATIPGKVLDEKGKQYDISRSFPAKPKQVSAVLRAAENYADRGGYNQYTRNCTTFAKEMVVDAAQIKSAEGIFAKDELWLHAKQDAKLFGAGAMAPIFKAEMENGFEKWRTKNDLDYRNYGSKMGSREDYEQYKNSLSLWSSRVTKGHSPNGTAENMRRTEGGKSGTIGMFDTIEDGINNYDNAPISIVTQQLVPLVQDLKTTLTSITPLDQLTNAKMPQELQDLMRDLDGQKILMDLVTLFPNQMDPKLFAQKTKQSTLVKGRTMMTDLIKKLNTLLFKYYRNDKRVQKKVLKIINALNHGINAIDDAYGKTDENDLTDNRGELKNLLNDYGRKEYNFTINGKQVAMNNSEYEAWLQVYGEPQKALTQYQKYYTLKNKIRSKQASEADKKDFEKLDRIHNLTQDFQRSHRYMLSKEKYNQQDVDYAFSLEKKERQGGVESDMFEQNWNDTTMANMKNPSASASGTYQMLIMKGVFGGMKDRFSNQFKDYKENKDIKNYKLFGEMSDWISADAADCIKSHQKEMETIIRAMKHTTDKPDDAKLRVSFSDLLTKWLFQLFRADLDPNQYRIIVKNLMSYKTDVMKEADKVITTVMEEDEAD